MWKSFVLNLYLVLLAWQVFCEDSAGSGPDFQNDADGDWRDSELNETDIEFVPQPRFIQVRTNQKSYTFNFLPVNWHTARELCTAQNQVLASIRSLQENQDIVSALMRYGFYYSDATFWIGGSQLGHIGQWSWVSTGQPFAFSNWQRNQLPDNYCNKHCVEITTNGKWSSNDCDLKRPVICEDLPGCN